MRPAADLKQSLHLVERIVNNGFLRRDNFAPLNIGMLVVKFSGRRLAASPMISKLLTTESMVFIVFHKTVVIQAGYVAFDFLNRLPNILDKKRRGPTGHRRVPL
jgi:hypothetical protein